MIKIDLNRISRRQFREFTRRLLAAQNAIEQDEISGEMIEAIVTEWPYGEITKDAYLDLPLLDSKVVDEAMEAALEEIVKKK